MFTYIKEDNVICTCDFLGAHYTFSDVFAVESNELMKSAKRYYAEIMMPFRMMCKRYTQMIKDLNVDMILPSHGPVYTNIVDDDLGDLAMALVDAATIVLGTSMVLAGPHPMAVNVAYLAAVLRPKAKFASLLGSYGWGGNLFGLIADMLKPLKLDLIEPLQVKGKPTAEDFKKLDEMAEQIYEKHKSIGII